MEERFLDDSSIKEADESNGINRGELFIAKVSEANKACQTGDFEKAVELYSQSIALNNQNHVLFSNRAATYIRLGKYSLALEDAQESSRINPYWPKAYYRQGVALQCMGRHSEALAAFAVALAQDKKSPQLLQAITEAAISSPYKTSLEPLISQLKKMELDMDPFVIIAIIGQELLAVGEVTSSICILESALSIGTENQKLHGSILSALSSAYWKTGDSQKALDFMLQDLEQVQQLNDEEGLCRAHGNLGNAYYSLSRFQEALDHHRSQLTFAMKLKDRSFAAAALTSLGHVYMSIGDHNHALNSHKRCALLRQQLNDKLAEARELGNVGSVYTAMGDFENAILCHKEHLKISEELGEKTEMSRAYSNLGSLYHNKRNFDAAIEHYRHALSISEELKDTSVQCRSIAGLGHAYRAKGELDEAVKCHAKQLKLAIDIGDRAMEGRARSNMGVTLQEKGQFREALEFHRDHLQLCGELDDKEGEGRACGNIGNAYHSLGQFERAIKYQKLGLALAKELRDKQSEATMHGNLAVAFQALGDEEDALQHYLSHLEMAKVLSDLNGQCLAESNLGAFFSGKGDFLTAISHLESQLSIAGELGDQIQLCKAFHNLAFAYYSIGKYDEAIDYYEKNIQLAEQNEDRATIQTAYCNLGLAYSAVKDYQSALSCQERYLDMIRKSEKVPNSNNLVRAITSLGETCLHLSDFHQALSFFQEQISLLKDSKPDINSANGHGGAGRAYRGLNQLPTALNHFIQETQIRRNLQDLTGLSDSLNNLGLVLFEQGDLLDAKRYFFEQLETADSIDNLKEKGRALSNLASCCFESKEYDECMKFVSSQLKLLEKESGLDEELAKAHGLLGNCYIIGGQYADALIQYQLQLKHSCGEKRALTEQAAYKGLGNCHLEMRNLTEALVYFEKCVVLARDVGIMELPYVYSKLGYIHSLLKNNEQSISYYEKELQEAKAQCNLPLAAKAYGELGGVYQSMKDYKTSQKYYEDMLHMAESLQDSVIQASANSGIGDVLLCQHRCKQAIKCFERCLELACKCTNNDLKFAAFTGLGKANHLLKRSAKANEYFKKATDVADVMETLAERVTSYFRLGVSFYVQCRYALAIENFEKCLFFVGERKMSCDEDKVGLFTSCAQKMIQRSLIMIKQEFKALVVAEKEDLCFGKNESRRNSIISRSVDKELEKLKNELSDVVIYYSIAVGHLLIWLLMPGGFLKKFVRVPLLEGFDDDNLSNLDVDDIAILSQTNTESLLEEYIKQVRNSLGVEKHQIGESLTRRESDGGDLADLVVEDASHTKRASRIGLPAKVQHPVLSSTPKAVFNFSLRPKRKESSSNKTKNRWDSTLQEASPLKSLYQLLISPLDDELAEFASQHDRNAEICFVVPKDLILVPFTLLVLENGNLFLRDRFQIRISPSLKFLLKNEKISTYVPGEFDYCVMGTRSRNAGTESHIVGDIFESKPLFGDDVSKDDIIKRFESAKICHFATDVIWGNESIVLGDLEVERSQDNSPTSDPDIESLDSEGRVASPPLPSTTLSVSDLKQLANVRPQLVVFGLTRSSWGDNISSKSVDSLVSAFLASGVRTLISSLWAVDAAPLKIFLSAFYKAYLNGEPSSRAFDYGVLTLKREQAFAHPSFWGGLLLFGQDSSLEKKKGSLTHILHLLLERPNRDAIKVLLHLVEKSRQRIAQCRRSSMYTAESSIRGKVGDALGWKDLLILVGFRFEKANNGLPDSVFFPSADYSDVLNRCSNTLYAFLGLTRNGLDALSKLRSSREAALPLITLLHDVIEGFANDVSYSQVSLNIKMWRIPGCHEFLSSLGFDLMGVGREDVLLRSGKSSLRRPLQCALQAVMDLFEIENESTEFMSSMSGKAYSETQIGESIFTNSSLNVQKPSNGGHNGHHPMRKARSTPIKTDNSNGNLDVNNNGVRRKSSNSRTNGSNGSHYLGAKVGLFGGMDGVTNDVKSDKDDLGASARRLRMRGVCTSSRSSLDASPEVLLCKDDRHDGKASRSNVQHHVSVESLSQVARASKELESAETFESKDQIDYSVKTGERQVIRKSIDQSADFEVEKYFRDKQIGFGSDQIHQTPLSRNNPKWRSSEQLATTHSGNEIKGVRNQDNTSISMTDISSVKPAKDRKKSQGAFWSRCQDIDSFLDGTDTATYHEMEVEMEVIKPSTRTKHRPERKSLEMRTSRQERVDCDGDSVSYLYQDDLKTNESIAETTFDDRQGFNGLKSIGLHQGFSQQAIQGRNIIPNVKIEQELPVVKEEQGESESSTPSKDGKHGSRNEKKVVKVSYGYVPKAQSLNKPSITVDTPSSSSVPASGNLLTVPTRKSQRTLLELRVDTLLQSGDIQASLC